MEYYESIEQEELIYPRWPGTLFFSPESNSWASGRRIGIFQVCVLLAMGWGEEEEPSWQRE